MAANTADIVAREQIATQARAKVEQIVNQIIHLVCSKEGEQSPCELENTLFQSVLQIGRLALEAHLALQATEHRHQSALHQSGVPLPYHGERRAPYQTIFGIVHLRRSYYCGNGLGHYEMDAALNLPPVGPSDFLRILLERLALSMSYEEASQIMADYFPVSRSTRSLQEMITVDSEDARDFYAQAPTVAIASEESILVVQGDGKGVPIIKEISLAKEGTTAEGCINKTTEPSKVSLPGKKKGEPKREGKKKMSTVVAVATYSPLTRTPCQIVESLFDQKSYTPAPTGHSFKRVWATIHGKEAAIAQSQTFVAQIADAPIKHRVLLTDGEVALKKQLCAAYPGFTHVLDLLHALSYLWIAADAKFGAHTQAATIWTRHATLRLLQGDASGVVEELYLWAEQTPISAKLTAIEKAAWYLDGNLSSMRYDKYLSKGWPIATGMVEGACRHVVKDRCERSGQRWTHNGVEGMLRLRCVEENGDWQAYHAYRMRRRQERIYGRTPQPPTKETQGILSSPDVYQFKTEIPFAEAV